MKIIGVIAEYNPFHNGHLYHLNQAKKITEANAVICIMNGNFTQRGLPALTDKWSRAEMAVRSGVDLIIELPIVFGIRSAQYFAEAAVFLLEQSNIIDELVFGSESGDIEPLWQIANFLIKEPENYQYLLKEKIKKGLSYPLAREKAIAEFFPNSKILTTIKKPNNILGIEYIKAILKHNLSLKPLTIKRTSNNYHSATAKNKFASATAIRKMINNKNISSIRKFLPSTSFKIINKEIKDNKIPIRLEALGASLLTTLRKTNKKELQAYSEINNGLENRIIEAALTAGSLKELIKKIKTKSLTQTRIQRSLLHILFGLNKNEFNKIDQSKPVYLRVLAFNNTGKKILSELSQKSSLPVITRLANHINQVDTSAQNPVKKQLSYDIQAGDIYSLLFSNTAYRKGRQDFYKKLLTL